MACGTCALPFNYDVTVDRSSKMNSEMEDPALKQSQNTCILSAHIQPDNTKLIGQMDNHAKHTAKATQDF